MDAYTAKKIIPRVVITIILINLSIYLVALAIDISNIIGAGIVKLIGAGFGDIDFTISNTASVFGGIGAIVGTLAVAAVFGPLMQFLLVFVGIPLLFAILGMLVTLIIRQALIIFLAISAPVALAMYVLPNTEKYAKAWFNLLLKTLLVYPIIMTIFALSRITPSLLNETDPNTILGVVTAFMSLVALVLPLFLVPFAFKIAGGAIGALFATLSGWSKRGHEGILGNPNDQNSLRNRSKRRLGESAAWKQASFSDAGRKLDASRYRKVTGWVADRFGNVDARLARYNALSKEQADQMSNTGRDALRYAAGGYKENGKYYNSRGEEISRNLYTRGKQLYGNTPTGVAQNLEYALRKAQTDEHVASMRKAFEKNAVDDNWTDDEIIDNWAAITYPHKSQLMASEWYSKPKANRDSSGRLTSLNFKDIGNDVVDTPGKQSSYSQYISDLHKTRTGPYQLPGRDQDYRAMLSRQTQLEDKILSGQQLEQYEADQLAMTYEVFDMASYSQDTRGMQGQDNGAGGVSGERASAGTAASQKVIEQAIKQRKARGLSLNTPTNTPANPNPNAANQRQIVRTLGPPLPHGAAGPPPPTVIVGTAQVTGDIDRSVIPR